MKAPSASGFSVEVTVTSYRRKISKFTFFYHKSERKSSDLGHSPRNDGFAKVRDYIQCTCKKGSVVES